MSGFNKNTGIFELTSKKARSWFRRKWSEFPQDVQDAEGFFESLVLVFAHEGIEAEDCGTFMKIKAPPSVVWEILSGQPSTKNYEYPAP